MILIKFGGPNNNFFKKGRGFCVSGKGFAGGPGRFPEGGEINPKKKEGGGSPPGRSGKRGDGGGPRHVPPVAPGGPPPAPPPRGPAEPTDRGVGEFPAQKKRRKNGAAPGGKRGPRSWPGRRWRPGVPAVGRGGAGGPFAKGGGDRPARWRGRGKTGPIRCPRSSRGGKPGAS